MKKFTVPAKGTAQRSEETCHEKIGNGGIDGIGLIEGTGLLLRDRVRRTGRDLLCPEGHVEAGESIVDAVIRGEGGDRLTVRIPDCAGVKQFPIEEEEIVCSCSRAEEFDGELTSSEERADALGEQEADLPYLDYSG